jgi:NAD(P)-dependent dehydrogenase (short-subunit alcohol dehydrogenase family)
MVDQRSNVAVITGGASGIGFAFARALIEKGIRVAIADISAERAASAAETFGDAAKGYRCDVADAESIGELALAVERDFGGINMLFVNAGVAVEGKLPETDPREFEWMFDVNVMGAFHTVRAFMPLLHKSADQGRVARVIFTGSENSLGLPINGMLTAYTATKHAVLALADGLRRDLKDTGIKVSIFCPGFVNTGLWDSRGRRQQRYGGAESLSEQEAEDMKSRFAAHGQDPALTARISLEGIERDEFLIITDPAIRSFATARCEQVYRALDTLDEFLARNGPDKTGATA